MIKVMFLCTGNACRSQMGEGFARELGKGLIEPYSAGLMANELHPLCIAVMEEVGIDITGQVPKEIDPELLCAMDVVVTLCKPVEDNCPRTPEKVRRIYRNIAAPVGTNPNDERIMNDFRRARDEVRDVVKELMGEISG